MFQILALCFCSPFAQSYIKCLAPVFSMHSAPPSSNLTAPPSSNPTAPLSSNLTAPASYNLTAPASSNLTTPASYNLIAPASSIPLIPTCLPTLSPLWIYRFTPRRVVSSYTYTYPQPVFLNFAPTLPLLFTKSSLSLHHVFRKSAPTLTFHFDL